MSTNAKPPESRKIMPNKRIDLTGKSFGHLTVIKFYGVSKSRDAMWECVCVCGNNPIMRGRHLRSGHSSSCGCIHRTGQLIHGKSIGDKTYYIWEAMHQRCRNKKSKYYSAYGGAGVSVCDRWNNFENFLSDMGEKPEGMSLDRIDSSGNYEPANCRWATNLEQQRNKRNSLFVEVDGTKINYLYVAEKEGISPYMLRTRLRKGLPLMAAINDARKAK